jgi:DNA-binding transcriptional ArsR family regulator
MNLPKQEERQAMSKRANSKGSAAEKPQEKPEGSFGRPAHEQLVKGLSHPVRAECLTVLAERVASPRELAETLDQDLSNVSYHVRVLDELGLIELVEEEPVRGAVAHYYKAVERPLISKEEWEEMPPEVRKAFSAHSWDVLIKDATLAIESGTFDSRADNHLSRTTLLLDAEGFARLSKAMDELLELVFEEQAASAERRNASGEESIRTTAAIALFEMPEPKATRR